MEAQQKRKEPQRLGRRPALDGLRGIAILLVMLQHTGLLQNGYVGVDVFFGLSGFLITTLLYEEWERSGGISFRAFYERRARRLLPALLLLLAAFVFLAVVFDPFVGWSTPHRVATTLLFANNWVTTLGNQHGLGALSPTWSLAQEEQFYIFWPALLWVMLRAGLRPAVVVAVLALAILALLEAVPHVEHALPAYNAYFSPLDRSAELLFGCAGAVLWRNRYVPWPLKWRVTEWVLVAAIAFLLFDHSMPLRWIYLGCAALSVPLIVALLSATDGLIARVLRCPPLAYLGRISYSLYLCNLMIHNLATHYLPGRSIYFYAAITFAVSIPAAAVSWHVLESRVLGRKAQKTRRRRSLRGVLGIRAPRPEHV
ncbi:MAG TPA: acyltransferase [Solirubrobacteraceae bacterium]|nr:acyltransferase [Solirubrobacteraceae bacterium]